MSEHFFKEVDLEHFWNDSSYALDTYVDASPSDDLIVHIESVLGFKLPESYIYFMRYQNGGIPINDCFPTSQPTSWAADHIAINAFLPLGTSKPDAIGGEMGSRFMIEDWGYPNIGIYIADCPSAGHDMIVLDYSEFGASSEPSVAHIDQAYDYRKTFLAKDFETFIAGLVHRDRYG